MQDKIMYIPCTDATSANGTSLQGYIEDVTTQQLIEMFGEPLKGSADGKVTMEWVIETQITTEDGDADYGVFTLYDWKGSAPDIDSTEWTINVGGTSKRDLWNAQRAFELFEKTDIRYTSDIACLAQGTLHDLETA